MQNTMRCLAAGCATLLAGFTALAQAEESSPVDLQQLTVTSLAADAESAHRVTLDADALQASPAERIDDVLLEVPSLSLFRRASSRVAHPTSQGVTLRGVAPSGTSRSLVLLDGVPLNDPFGGWIYWNRVPLLALERASVASGGVSNSWGSAALAGLISLESGNETLTRMRVGLGNRGQRSAAVLSRGAIQHGTLEFGMQFADSDGYPVLPESQRGVIDVPAYDSHRAAWIGASQSWGDAIWSVRGGAFKEERGNGTQLTGNDTEISWGQSRVLWQQGDSQWEWVFYGQDQELASSFSSQTEERDSELPALDQFSVPASAVGTALRWGNGNWGAGFDARHLKGETNERYFFSDGDFVNQRKAGATQDFAGAWVNYSGQLNGWNWQASGRGDWWQLRDAFRRQWNRESGERSADLKYPDRDGWEFSPRFDLGRKIGQQSKVRLAAWRSFRVPTINELVRPFRVRSDITAANAALDVEHLSGVDVGWDWRSKTVASQLTVFWSQLDDAVANITLTTESGPHPVCGFVPGGGSCRQRQNLDRITAQGVEWDLRWTPHQSWQANLGVFLADNQVDEGPAALQGKDLAQVPDYRVTLMLQHRGWLQSDLRVRHVGAQFEDDQNNRELDAYTTLDLRISREARPGLELSLSAENVFDTEYDVAETANGLQTIGMPRLLMFRVTWSGV